MWWVPGETDREIPGRLTFSSTEGARLELFGGLGPEPEGKIGAERLPVIYGRTHDADITLFRALRTRATLLVHRDWAREAFVSSSVLMGGHVESWEALQITASELALTQLDEWLDVGGFSAEVSDPKDADATAEFLYRVTYRRVDIPSVFVRGATFKFAFETSAPLSFSREINLREHARLLITLDAPMAFEDFNRTFVWRTQNLLTFAVDRPSEVTNIRVKLVQNGRWAEVIRSGRPDRIEAKGVPHVLFAYTHVSGRLAALLESWFTLYDQLGPALNSVFSVIYNDVRPLDTKFLNIAQAAESYHRRQNPLTPEQLQQHSDRVERIVATAPEADKEWLRGKLAHAAEPFFTERLAALFGRLGDDFLRPMFPTSKKLDGGIRHIAEWRNKLTHMRAEPEQILTALTDIYARTNQLLFMLKANLLLDLGFDHEHLLAAFKYNQTYRFFSRRDAPF